MCQKRSLLLTACLVASLGLFGCSIGLTLGNGFPEPKPNKEEVQQPSAQPTPQPPAPRSESKPEPVTKMVLDSEVPKNSLQFHAGQLYWLQKDGLYQLATSSRGERPRRLIVLQRGERFTGPYQIKGNKLYAIISLELAEKRLSQRIISIDLQALQNAPKVLVKLADIERPSPDATATVREFIVDNTALYWPMNWESKKSVRKGEIWKVSLRDGTIQRFAELPQRSPFARQMNAGGGYVWWTSSFDGQRRMPVGGGPIETLNWKPRGTFTMFYRDGIFWAIGDSSGFDTVGVYRFSPEENKLDVLFKPGRGVASNIVRDEKAMYYIDTFFVANREKEYLCYVCKVPFSGPYEPRPPTHMPREQHERFNKLTSLAIGPANLYWIKANKTIGATRK